ncbi:hypothetical protein C0585_03510 [Candidatus Woesearchaeota archaeon]|nr:MAG: hypothetical protein C0585_03510 [Candidatus Woesearchaeota archaeon]
MSRILSFVETKNFTFQVIKDTLESIKFIKKGHLGACMSSAELLCELYVGGHLNIKNGLIQDKIILRGHVGPLRYSIFEKLGYITKEELMTIGNIGSRLQGHEDMKLTPGVDITPSGSLGMVLSYGVGSAIASRNSTNPWNTFVFLGDGEEQEGMVSEAARHASHLNLEKLICILDKNQKQLSKATNKNDSVSNINQIWSGYGWDILEIDGHNLYEINHAYVESINNLRPTLIIANTVKGNGLEGALESSEGYHTTSALGKNLDSILELSLNEIYNQINMKELGIINSKIKKSFSKIPETQKFENVKTIINIKKDGRAVDANQAISMYLSSLGKIDKDFNVYVFWADILPELATRGFTKLTEALDFGIREQHMLSAAHGVSITDRSSRIIIPYGDAFLYRCADQLNTIAQSGSNVILLSSYAGLSGAMNGSTHQSSGQAGMILTMPGFNYYEPCDYQDMINCLNKSINNAGANYIRLHSRPFKEIKRDKNDLLNTNLYALGSKNPDYIIFSSGDIVNESIQAVEELKQETGICGRVINVVGYNETKNSSLKNLVKSHIPVLTIYNGNPFILSSYVSNLLLKENISPSSLINLGFEIGTTGYESKLRSHFGLDSARIKEIVKKIV